MQKRQHSPSRQHLQRRFPRVGLLSHGTEQMGWDPPPQLTPPNPTLPQGVRSNCQGTTPSGSLRQPQWVPLTRGPGGLQKHRGEVRTPRLPRRIWTNRGGPGLYFKKMKNFPFGRPIVLVGFPPRPFFTSAGGVRFTPHLALYLTLPNDPSNILMGADPLLQVFLCAAFSLCIVVAGVGLTPSKPSQTGLTLKSSLESKPHKITHCHNVICSQASWVDSSRWSPFAGVDGTDPTVTDPGDVGEDGQGL